MKMTLSLTLLIFVSLSSSPSTGHSQSASETKHKYPNELSGYQFYENAKWKPLEPLVSTMVDVRKVLGEPNETSDVSQFTKPYPGDALAKLPVFSYDVDDDWEVLIYFVKYSDCKCPKLRKSHGDLLYSLELLPKKRIPFTSVIFPSVFQKKDVSGVDAAWVEYADGSGLSYEVYTTKQPYGTKQPGDLNRIVYAPSAEDVDIHER